MCPTGHGNDMVYEATTARAQFSITRMRAYRRSDCRVMGLDMENLRRNKGDGQLGEFASDVFIHIRDVANVCAAGSGLA
ncbi:hypothetical protein BOC41_22745 [Burkholderia pseudomallei]|nr:hypothetical protein BOC44_25810 [Burkholderia pseudomallei]OSP90869.1 hypothetical protein BOC41_22745 [Burkholderia pseudomallei]